MRRRRRRDIPRHPRESFSRRVAILWRRRRQPVRVETVVRKTNKKTKKNQRQRSPSDLHPRSRARDSSRQHGPSQHGTPTACCTRRHLSSTDRTSPALGSRPSASAQSALLSRRTGGQALLNVGPAIADGGACGPANVGRRLPWPEGANGAAAAERPLDDVNACEGGGAVVPGADLRRWILHGGFRREFVARQSATTSHMRWSTSTSIPSIHVVSSANDEEFCLDSADASRSSSRMLSRDAKSMEHSRTKRGVSELGAGGHAARDSAAARRFSGDRTSSSSSSSVASSSVSDDDGARLRLCGVSRGHRHVSESSSEPSHRAAASFEARRRIPSSSSPSCVWLWRRGRVEIGEDRARPGGDAAAFARIEDPASTRTERSDPGGEGRRETRASLSAVGRRCRWLGFWETGGLPARAGIALCVVASTARAPLPPLTSESGPAHMARYS